MTTKQKDMATVERSDDDGNKPSVRIVDADKDGGSLVSRLEVGANLTARLLVGVVVLVVLGLAIAFFVLHRSNSEEAEEQAAGRAAQKAATDTMRAVLSYTPDDVETSIDDESAMMTSGFATSFRKLMAESVVPTATKDGVTTQATIVKAGIVKSTTEQVEVLMFINIATSTVKQPTADVRGSRVVATMKSVDGKWKVDKFRPI